MEQEGSETMAFARGKPWEDLRFIVKRYNHS
jgi:hypothetical protein